MQLITFCPIENTFIPIKNSWRQKYIGYEKFLNASDACFQEFHTLLENVPYIKYLVRRLYKYTFAASGNDQLMLKLTCRHINRRHICFNIKSISVNPLLWMNVMLDFICMVFAGMLTMFRQRKFQNDNVCLRRESNPRSLAFQRVPLTTRLSGEISTCCQNFYSTF